MRIADRLGVDGGFLFRWRSFLPLALLPLFLAAMSESSVLLDRIGETGEHVLYWCGLAVSFAGLAVRWVTVAFVPARTSGRNTKEQRAEVLNVTGTYSIVRNPLYLGNYLALLGLTIVTGVWWLAVIVSLIYWLYIERVIAAEEAFLTEKFGTAYRDWCAVTPAFFPRLSGWRGSDAGFSLRTVLKREYNGVLAVLAAFFAIDILTDLAVRREPVAEWLADDRSWVLLFAFGLCFFLVLRTLKKSTRALHVKGR